MFYITMLLLSLMCSAKPRYLKIELTGVTAEPEMNNSHHVTSPVDCDSTAKLTKCKPAVPAGEIFRGDRSPTWVNITELIKIISAGSKIYTGSGSSTNQTTSGHQGFRQGEFTHKDDFQRLSGAPTKVKVIITGNDVSVINGISTGSAERFPAGGKQQRSDSVLNDEFRSLEISDVNVTATRGIVEISHQEARDFSSISDILTGRNIVARNATTSGGVGLLSDDSQRLNISNKDQFTRSGISTGSPVISRRTGSELRESRNNFRRKRRTGRSEVSDKRARRRVKKLAGGKESADDAKPVEWQPAECRNATCHPAANRTSGTSGFLSNVSGLSEDEEARNQRILYAFRSAYPIEQWKNCCYFSEDFLASINPHWLQFTPPDRSSHYILASLYAVIMVVGLFGNYLVIFMFLRCRSLQTPANILVANLAVSDFFLLSKMPVFIFNSFHRGPALGTIGCQIYGFMGGLTGTVSIMTLAAIALDRYLVVVYPLNPFKNTTRQRARACVAFVWAYGLFFASIPLFDVGLNRYVPEGYLTACSFDYLSQDLKSRLFILVFFVAAWLVPFTIITFCYISICFAVVRTKNVPRFGQEKEKRRVELRLAGVVIFVIALWFVSWTPYAIVALLGILRQTEYLSPHVSMIPALFCKTASCADPYIYAITNPKFKRELCRLFDKSYQSKSKWSKQTGTTYRNKTPTSNKPVQTIEDTAHRTHYPSTFNSSSADD
nr:PREDICTED: neuromedin-U receptor 2-like [Bemisia tabaci]